MLAIEIAALEDSRQILTGVGCSVVGMGTDGLQEATGCSHDEERVAWAALEVARSYRWEE